MVKRTKAVFLTVLAHVADVNVETPQTTNQTYTTPAEISY